MSDSPNLTDSHWQILACIADHGDTILFDLEVAELAHLGLVRQSEAGTLDLTQLGRDMLASWRNKLRS